MKRIVCDSGPLLHLAESDLTSLLPLAGEVSAPLAVCHEVAAVARPWKPPEWLRVVRLAPAAAADARRWMLSDILDPGEAEALALARQLEADWLLTDDAAARWVAESIGQEVHGSLGVVLWAAATRHLTTAEAQIALTRLAESSLWVSARVLAEARAALDRMGA